MNRIKIGLVGNPNTGKSSLFNLLTGMNQKVGNFPGVTVEQKTGSFHVGEKEVEIIDFPGVYSIYPKSEDENVVYRHLIQKNKAEAFDALLYIIDATNIERNLFLLSQLYDLGFNIIAVLNMVDLAKRKGIEIDLTYLQKAFPGITFVPFNARIGLGKDRLLDCISGSLDSENRQFFISDFTPHPENENQLQEEEAELRYKRIKERIKGLQITSSHDPKETKTGFWDSLITHRFFGFLMFAAIMFTIFQSIFTFAQYPMEWIDLGFGMLSNTLSKNLPEGILNELITQGIVPGLGGIFVFIPQIMLLFFFISILEDTGYLSRVVFILDRIMRPLGLNGKSVVPLISSFACAIPGIMSTRTIPNWKERLITIFIAPLMSCSARIPVFTLLIALVIPKESYGIINLQGLVMFAMYFLGILGAMLIAFILKKVLKSKGRQLMIIELPSFKYPRFRSIVVDVFQKVKIFTLEAGKIILAISVVLWALSTYGPEDSIQEEISSFIASEEYSVLSEEEQDKMESKIHLEHSFIGIIGKSIEPVIRPMGFDWKIGISLITSFAAREVFVGSLATIYSAQSDESNGETLISKLSNEKLENGEKAFHLANGLSLMVFYVFAMQCMATFSVVKRETNSWKWPLVQLLSFGVIAYVCATTTYWFFSM